MGVGLALTGFEWKGGGMKRNAWIALLSLAVVIVPVVLWWYRMERSSTA